MRDTITLTGDYEDRVAQLLRIAQAEANLAQKNASPRVQDAMVELEDALADQLEVLARAIEDDAADAEDAGSVERERQSWRPLRAA
jgi:hypothetical protein